MSTVPELLSPAGDFDAMRAAVANGADAVYFGLSNFNARHRAANFTLEELPGVMEFLHGHNVRGYVTFNTLIFSDELPEAIEFLAAVAKAGVDAVIVQDLGLARLIGRLCPALHIHGSTQMTLTEPRGIEFVKSLGVKRVILARELSATDIRKITAATAVPVEVFIHGALCVSYSGQCLTSEALGGRSANRGQCAQACRLPYDLIVDGQEKPLGDKAYLLSPQDLAAYDLVDDLAKLGVCSLKIEGRLKSAHYVAATTQTYRSAIDASAGSQPFQLSHERQHELAQSFSRGFTHGFFDGVNHQKLVHARFPKSRGIQVGKVAGRTDEGLLVELKVDVKPGDGVVFDEGHPEQDEQGGRIFAVRPAPLLAVVPKAHVGISGTHKQSQTCAFGTTAKKVDVKRVELMFGRGSVNLAAVAIGATVWKTDDPAIRRRLEKSYSREGVARRVPLHTRIEATVGSALVIGAYDDIGHTARVSWPGPLALAQKHPLSAELFREQFGRLGDTPFELGRIEIGGDTWPPVMVPKSVLNDLRRQAVAQLLAGRDAAAPLEIAEANVVDNIRREIRSFTPSQSLPAPLIYALVRTTDQLQAVLDWFGPVPLGMVYLEFEDIRRYAAAVQLAKAKGIPVGIATTRIIKPGEEGFLQVIAAAAPDAVLIRNLAGLTFFREKYPQMQLIADYAMNIANEVTAMIFAENGIGRMVPSYDLNWKQLTAMLGRFPASFFEAVIHQHMPMFHMEHCVFCHTLSTGTDYRDCGRPCDTHKVDLRDRVSADHPLIADVGCRNTVFNGTAQSGLEFVGEMRQLGIAHFRIEFLRENADGTIALLDRYARVVGGLETGRGAWRQLKVLNQLGVTRGTLE